MEKGQVFLTWVRDIPAQDSQERVARVKPRQLHKVYVHLTLLRSYFRYSN